MLVATDMALALHGAMNDVVEISIAAEELGTWLGTAGAEDDPNSLVSSELQTTLSESEIQQPSCWRRSKKVASVRVESRSPIFRSAP